MRVRWLRRALFGLDRARDFIAQNNPQAAARTVQRIREGVELLAEQPSIGRPGRVPGTRELIVPNTPFIVPYRVQGETVQILHVLHGARRWPERF